ncbi:MAG: hypothetical protein JWP90_2113, partial [Mycetocola sp.]|nr:hypothetical protein [Mycetocola sp.]
MSRALPCPGGSTAFRGHSGDGGADLTEIVAQHPNGDPHELAIRRAGKVGGAGGHPD